MSAVNATSFRRRRRVCWRRVLRDLSERADFLHGDAGAFLSFRPRTDLDADFQIQSVQEPLQSLHAEAGQLAPDEIRHVWLRHAEQICRLRLGQTAFPDHLPDDAGKFRLCQAFLGIRHTHVTEDIASAIVNFLIVFHRFTRVGRAHCRVDRVGPDSPAAGSPYLPYACS
jgi:hypothetical protein